MITNRERKEPKDKLATPASGRFTESLNSKNYLKELFCEKNSTVKAEEKALSTSNKYSVLLRDD